MMGDMAADQSTFYEDDEPIERIRTILSRPADGITARPVASVTNVRGFASGSSKTASFTVASVRTLPSSTPARLPRRV